MPRQCVAAALLLLKPASVAAVDVYVSGDDAVPAGDDAAGDGSAAAPYRTLLHAVTTRKAELEAGGAKIYISGTHYPPDSTDMDKTWGQVLKDGMGNAGGYGKEALAGRTVVLPTLKVADAGLTVTAAPNAAVARFDGRVNVDTVALGRWQQHKRGDHGGKIWKRELSRPVWQLFIGDAPLTVARIPNVELDWFDAWPNTYPQTMISARACDNKACAVTHATLWV